MDEQIKHLLLVSTTFWGVSPSLSLTRRMSHGFSCERKHNLSCDWCSVYNDKKTRFVGLRKQNPKIKRKECMSVWSRTGSVAWLRPERLWRRLFHHWQGYVFSQQERKKLSKRGPTFKWFLESSGRTCPALFFFRSWVKITRQQGRSFKYL